MLNQQEWTAALAVERKMYGALSEVLDLTRELSDAVGRQDQVSVRLFLQMRQEQINLLRECREALKKQCQRLPPQEGESLRLVLAGEAPDAPEGNALLLQVRRNRALLERVIELDQRVNQRLGGKKSFYTVRKRP